jgi:hypothetical protein
MINDLFLNLTARYLLMTVSHTIKVSYDHTQPELCVGKEEGSRSVAGSWYKQGDIFTVLGIELRCPILSEPSRTTMYPCMSTFSAKNFMLIYAL